jgi:hypothetical protein
MKRNAATVTTAAVIAAIALSCSEKSAAPAAPTPPVIITVTPPPTVTAPTVQSPVGGLMLSGLTATLTATAATVDVATLVLQYRFQVFNDAGTLVQDSGLVKAPTWTTTVTLTPNKTFTWKVRAESDGWIGPWSATASFATPDPPPAFAGPIGDWESCASLINDIAQVTCVWNAVRPTNSVGDLEVVKRVAWLRRKDGAGLLIKVGGENVVLWQGYSLSATRMCYSDGHIYKLIGDAGPGGSNGPGFADNGFVDKSMYVPAIDPRKP